MNEENEYEEVWGKAASLDSTDFNKKLASLKLIMYGTGTKSTDETTPGLKTWATGTMILCLVTIF